MVEGRCFEVDVYNEFGKTHGECRDDVSGVDGDLKVEGRDAQDVLERMQRRIEDALDAQKR